VNGCPKISRQAHSPRNHSPSWWSDLKDKGSFVRQVSFRPGKVRNQRPPAEQFSMQRMAINWPGFSSPEQKPGACDGISRVFFARQWQCPKSPMFFLSSSVDNEWQPTSQGLQAQSRSPEPVSEYHGYYSPGIGVDRNHRLPPEQFSMKR